MKYGKIVVRKLEDQKVISESCVMPSTFLKMAYVIHLTGEAVHIMDRFSYTQIEECDESEYDQEKFLEFLKNFDK